MASFLDQFIAFGTDAAGLERTMRFIQSIAIIVVSYPMLLSQLLSTHPVAKHAVYFLTIRKLMDWLNVTRRSLRTFRFLESWKKSQTMYESQAAKSIEDWLDIISASTMGMYGMLETATLVDVLRIENLSIFGQERSATLNERAQMFWLVALYSAALGSGIKLLRLFAYRAVPDSGAGFAGKDSKNDEKKAKNEKTSAEDRQKEREAANREFNGKVSQLGLKMLAEVLDVVLPTASLGLMKIYPGIVGIAMLGSTVITGRNVWIRCAQKLPA